MFSPFKLSSLGQPRKISQVCRAENLSNRQFARSPLARCANCCTSPVLQTTNKHCPLLLAEERRNKASRGETLHFNVGSVIRRFHTGTVPTRASIFGNIHIVGIQNIRGRPHHFDKLIQIRSQHTRGRKDDKQSPSDEDARNDENSFISQQTRNQIHAILTQAQSIPNIITIARISATPFLCHFILTDQYTYAVAGCVVAGISDWLDGYIARKYNQTTVMGTYLDPLADKIFINGIAISLGYANIIPIWCAGVWLGRDVLLIGMAYRAAAIASEGKGYNVADPSRTPLKIEPSMISRINTVLQFGTIWAGLGFAAMGGEHSSALGTICVFGGSLTMTPVEVMCYIACGTTVYSGIGYLDGTAMTKSNNNK